jgi:thiol-disulfide isomerase/thioredoxin
LKRIFAIAALGVALSASLIFSPAAAATVAETQPDAETRVLGYIRDHLRPGEPLLVTELYNQVFTQPDERRALNRLYNAFFRIPLFATQYQAKFGHPPSLSTIAEQFSLKSPRDADTLLRIMEADPRVPQFLIRDPKSGEITRVDTEKILKDSRFSKIVERQLGGMEGQAGPEFLLPGLGQPGVSSEGLRGKTVLLYVWFTGCPPCMKETPELVALQRDFAPRNFTVAGANADKLLGLAYDDAAHQRYMREQKINFPMGQWTRESDNAFGSIAIFPTLFLLDAKGIILHHWVGYTSSEEIRKDLTTVLTR